MNRTVYSELCEITTASTIFFRVFYIDNHWSVNTNLLLFAFLSQIKSNSAKLKKKKKLYFISVPNAIPKMQCILKYVKLWGKNWVSNSNSH